MRIQLNKFLQFVVSLIFFFTTSGLFADMVVLRSGQKMENVKVSIGPDKITVKTEDGRTENYKKSSVKNVKIIPVHWKMSFSAFLKGLKKIEKPKIEKTDSDEEKKRKEAEEKRLAEEEERRLAEEEKERVAKASEKGSDWEPRAEEDLISPGGNAALGLIPGYSGLYRTKNYVGGGIFSFLEVAAFVNALDYLTEKRMAHKATGNDMVDLYMYQVMSAPNNSFGSLAQVFQFSFASDLLSNYQNHRGYQGGFTGSVIIKQGVSTTTKEQNIYNAKKVTSYAVLSAFLITDAIISYFSASSWNEGTFTGEKSSGLQRPTTKSARFGRSFFIPGFGQIYGGDTGKGITFLTISALAFANAISKEMEIPKVKRDYETPLGSGVVLVSALGTLPLLDVKENRAIIYMKIFSQQKREELVHAVEERNKAWSLFAAIWAVNLIDAVWFSGTDKVTGLFFKPDVRYVPASNLVGTNSYMGVQLDYRF